MAISFLVALGMLTAPYGYTLQVVEEGQRRLLFDHEAHEVNSASVGIKELDTKILGESVDLGNGELTLKHEDISIPGNSNLQVNFTRVATNDSNRPNFLGDQSSSKSRGLANFHLDAAYLLLPSIRSTGVVGCVSDSTIADVTDELYVSPVAYLPHDPQPLLKASGTPNSDIFGTVQPDYTTKSMSKIKQMKEGLKCKWSLTETNGNVYEFDQERVIETKSGKKKHAMLVTKVTDVHGNWVKYSYGGSEKRLEKIWSNDGRVIVIVYNSDGTVECAIGSHGSKTTSPIVWVYGYASISGQPSLKYLKTARIRGTTHYWEYDQLAGITSHYGNEYAIRCTFGQTASVRHPSGLVAEYSFEKIVNFEQAQSPNGHVRTSHRAACLPPTDVYNNVGSQTEALRSASISDGTSRYGKFSTFFSSALVKKELKHLDGTSAVWTIQYDEGDLFNANPSKFSLNKTVHKNRNNPVAVDITKPKTRTVTDPLGNKHIVKIGRSLNNSGLLVSKEVYAKGKSKPALLIENEYVHSKKRLGLTSNRSKTNLKSAEHWVRLSKRKFTQDGVTYTTLFKYDVYGLPTKVTKSSTLQSGSIIEETTYTHKKSKWIIGLVKTFTKNGREISGASYDSRGNKILETKYGEDFMRFNWNPDGTLATKRNGNNKDTRFSNYKRGLPQTTVYPNGGVEMQVVDDNGNVIQSTNRRNYVEKTSFNNIGRKTKIDLPESKTTQLNSRYSDTTITHSGPTSSKGLVKIETTVSGKLTKTVTTTHNGYGQPILIEKRDSTTNASIFERIKYDNLGREVFRSFPSTQANESSGAETTYDVLGRKIMERENVSPFKTEKIQFLNNNTIKFIDPMGNTKTVRKSGYGSPYDGKVTQITEANGRKTVKTYDKWLNLIKVRSFGGGRNLISTFKYDSHNQLCMYTFPESSSTLLEYNSIRKVRRLEKGVDKNASCKNPISISIATIERKNYCHSVISKVKIKNTSETSTEYRAQTQCATGLVLFPSFPSPNFRTTDPYTPPAKKPSTVPTTSPSTSPSTSPPSTPNKTPTNPPGNSGFPNCKPNEVFNGDECIKLPNGGQVHSETIQAETGIIYRYNDLEQLAVIDYPGKVTKDIYYSYDIAGNPIKIVKGNVTLDYKFRANGQITNEKPSIVELNSNGESVTKSFKAAYVYNGLGGLQSYFSPKLRIFSFELNAFNLPTSISVANLKLISNMKYHANNVLKSAEIHSTNASQNSNTIEVRNTLNSRMLIEKTELLKDKEPLFSFSSTFYTDRRVKSVVNNLKSGKKIGDRTLTYDVMNQVKSAVGDGRSVTYSYDLFENILSQSESTRTVENTYDVNRNLVKKNLLKVLDGNGNWNVNLLQNVTNDSEGRITKLGELSLAYDESNLLIEAARTTPNPATSTPSNRVTRKEVLKFLNDGNMNRAKKVHSIIADIRELDNRMLVTTYEFHSIFGELLLMSVSTDPEIVGNSNLSEVDGDHDIVKLSPFISLIAKDCLNLVILNRTNNNSVILNSDLSVQRHQSVGPYGQSWDDNSIERKGCETDRTIYVPPDLAGPYFPISLGLSSSPTISSLSRSTVTVDSPSTVFQDAVRDSVTRMYFLKNKRYYDTLLGRYISPRTREVIEFSELDFSNRYSIAKNDPVNFRFNEKHLRKEISKKIPER